MGITRTPTVIDTNTDVFLVEFLNPAGYLVAVSPLYVVGVEETINGVSIRTARGAVADQFMVSGPVRSVVDRLRDCWNRAQDSFVASFLRTDLGAMEDRLMQRVAQSVDPSAVGAIVRAEIEHMAAGVQAPTPGKPVKTAKP